MTSLRAAPDYEFSPASFDPQAFDQLPLRQWPAQWHPTSRFPTPQSVGESPVEQELSQLTSFDDTPSFYRLGDPDLPVSPYRRHTLDIVRDNQASITTAETGSGKSSQLGLWLIEEGYPRVFVAQPRVIAARNLSLWGRANLGERHEYLVGHTTGNAEDSLCQKDAQLIYPTGEKLYKMAVRGLLRPDDTVIVDEAHERDVSMVMLLWEMMRLLPENPDMRLIVSSATIDVDKFANYLSLVPGEPAPILTFPGRRHQITEQTTDMSVAAAMRQQMKEGNNVLAFERGVKSIQATAARAGSRNSKETVHVLYGDQSPRQQAAALDPSPHTHVVSSEVGGISITPPNKQVVVDSGWSNYGGYEEGVSVLKTLLTSQARLRQHFGRVGRDEPGIAILAQADDAPPSPAMAARPEYDPPIIENSSVASYLLELYAAGRELEVAKLIEQPTTANLEHDKKLLRRLGAIAVNTDNQVAITEIGDAMRHLPLDAPLARMVVEAGRQDDIQIDQELLRMQVAAAAAILSVKGILNQRSGSEQRYLRRKPHEDVLSSEKASDVLFALDVFTWCLKKQQELQGSGKADHEKLFEKLLVDSDVLPNRYYKALRTYRELCRRLDMDSDAGLTKPTAAHRKRIVACQITGAEEVFVQRRGTKFIHRDIRGERRTLGRRSTIAANMAELVVGSAFDLRGINKKGHYEHKFIAAGSVVTPEDLLRHIPHRISSRDLGCVVSKSGKLLQRQALYFDEDMEFTVREVDLPPTVETRVALITAMMTGRAPSAQDPTQMVAFHPATRNASSAIARWKQAQGLEQRSLVKLNIEKRYKSLILKVINQTLKDLPLEVTDMAILDDWIPRVYTNALVKPSRKNQVPEILRRSPDSVEVQCEDETNMHLPVGYRNGVAYVTVPREVRFSMRRSSFEGLLKNYEVKLRIGRGKYQHIDAAFDIIEEQRPAEMAKRARRAELRELRAAAANRRDGEKTRRERRREDESIIEADIRAAIDRSLRFVRKGNHKNNLRMRRRLEVELKAKSQKSAKAAKQVVAAAL